MSRIRTVLATAFLTVLSVATLAQGQGAAARPGHLITVRLVEKSAGSSYVFEPANVLAQPGDTLRFLEGAGVMHDVHFKTHPSGAHLGSTTTGPYLTTPGQRYDVLIDGRFVAGKYEFVCDPHEMLGMKGVLTVQ